MAAREVIDITDDEDPHFRPRILIDLDFPDSEIDGDSDEDYSQLVAHPEIQDQTPSRDLAFQGLAQTAATRNGRLTPDLRELREHIVNNIHLKPEDTVELHGSQPGEFLRIKQIIQRSNGEVFLRGLPFHRNKHFGPVFVWQLNEVFMAVKIDGDDDRPSTTQGMEDADADLVHRKRNLKITDKDWPALSFNEQGPIYDKDSPEYRDMKRDVRANGVLVCRWVYEQEYENATVRLKGAKARAGTIRRVRPVESDLSTEGFWTTRKREVTGHRALKQKDPTSKMLRRGSSILRKRALSRSPSLEILEEAPHRKGSWNPKQYSFGDCFCCSGGASRGAMDAGLKVKWGFDSDPKACLSYQVNFPRAKCKQIEAADFPPPGFDAFANVINISTVCRTWSPDHTREGKDDEKNADTLYTVGGLLKRIKPDIATLEQTFGLFHHHYDFFVILLGQIIQEGYSLRFKIDDMRKWGLTARRQRLLILASKPGVPLPNFPRFTHGNSQLGLSKYRNVNEAIRGIPQWASFSDVMKYSTPKNASSYNGDTHSSLGCITRSGGKGNVHPSGTRSFTPRELARLNGCPDVHEFVGSKTTAMSQIGDIFPPSVYKLIAEECIKSLDIYYGRRSESGIDTDDDLPSCGIGFATSKRLKRDEEVAFRSRDRFSTPFTDCNTPIARPISSVNHSDTIHTFTAHPNRSSTPSIVRTRPCHLTPSSFTRTDPALRSTTSLGFCTSLTLRTKQSVQATAAASQSSPVLRFPASIDHDLTWSATRSTKSQPSAASGLGNIVDTVAEAGNFRAAVQAATLSAPVQPNDSRVVGKSAPQREVIMIPDDEPEVVVIDD